MQRAQLLKEVLYVGNVGVKRATREGGCKESITNPALMGDDQH